MGGDKQRHLVTFRVSDRVLRDVERLCVEHDRPRSWVCRRLVEQALPQADLEKRRAAQGEQPAPS